MPNLSVYPGNRLIVRRSPTFIKAILLSGIAAGFLQLAGMTIIAWLARGIGFINVLHHIASGICGDKAFEEGAASAFAGLFLHCMFSFVVALVYMLIYNWAPFVRKHPIRAGMAFGVLVWFIMNGAVIPLSHIAPQTPDPLMATLSLSVNVFFTGIPVALVAHACYAFHQRHVPDITEMIWHT